MAEKILHADLAISHETSAADTWEDLSKDQGGFPTGAELLGSEGGLPIEIGEM